MADNAAFQALYDQELIAAFERKQSVLRNTCTTRGIVKGNTFIFDVVGSGGATATTRGVNGKIPERSDSNTQYSVSASSSPTSSLCSRTCAIISSGDFH